MKALTPKLIPVLLAVFALNAVAATTRYVNLNNPSPAPPYTDWLTAATNIQDAVDAAVAGDLILVTNGIYLTGGRVDSETGTMNRVVVTNAVMIQSRNGQAVTVIDGGHEMRCVYLISGAMLDGFTITNGYSGTAGGGVYCASTNALVANSLVISNTSSYGGGVAYGAVSNCTLASNHSSGSGGGAGFCMLSKCILSQNSADLFGGGASGGISTLDNCLIVSNSAANGGGGVFGSTLDNCIVISNRSTGIGGAARDCVLRNCTVVGNSAVGIIWSSASGSLIPKNNNCIVYYNAGLNYLGGVTMTNCCTSPLPPGIENFTNPPLFANIASGDLRLQSNSPCINAGKNSVASAGNDFDGKPRIVGEVVDIGAYEYQLPTSTLSYVWLQKFGLPTDGSADFTDADGEGMNNWGEWRSDTNPTNALSVLRMVSLTNSPGGKAVTWQSVSTRNYWLERATNLGLASPFQSIATNIVGVAGVKTFTDPSATNVGPYFYRVGVQ